MSYVTVLFVFFAPGKNGRTVASLRSSPRVMMFRVSTRSRFFFQSAGSSTGRQPPVTEGLDWARVGRAVRAQGSEENLWLDTVRLYGHTVRQYCETVRVPSNRLTVRPYEGTSTVWQSHSRIPTLLGIWTAQSLATQVAEVGFFLGFFTVRSPPHPRL